MKPIEISREMFEQHCRPRFGVGNPERIVNPYWEWEIRRRIEGNAVYPSRVKHVLGIDFKDKAYSPTWTCSRMGSTETVLSDGTRVSVAGEYEDWYDPDFCIYNDVIVVSPSRGDFDLWLSARAVSADRFSYGDAGGRADYFDWLVRLFGGSAGWSDAGF